MVELASARALLRPIPGDIVEEARRRFVLRERALEDARFQDLIVARGAKDPVWWISTWVWAVNPAAKSRVVPFALYPFQERVVRAVLGLDGYRNADGEGWRIVLDKSRELGASWLVVACAVWSLLHQRYVRIGMLTRSGTDLDGADENSLLGKVDHILNGLPRWMVDVERDIRRSTVHHSITYLPTKSSIKGSRTVDSPFRSGRHAWTFIDEAACVPNLERVMASVNGVTRRPILVGTPLGRVGAFPKLVHGESVETHELEDADGGGRGWLHLRLHYSEHPERDPTTEQGQRWFEATRAGYTDEAWAQEQDCDYDASAPGRILAEFSRRAHLHSEEEWYGALLDDGTRDEAGSIRAWLDRRDEAGEVTWIEAWDFGEGSSLTCVVWAAWVHSRLGRHKDRVYFVDYRVWRRALPDEVAAGVAAAGWATKATPRARHPHVRLGDPYGRRVDSTQKSWTQHLEDLGISIGASGLGRRIHYVIQTFRMGLRDLQVFFAPDCDRVYDKDLPTLTRSMENYRRNERTHLPEKTGQKGIFSHLADAAQMVIDEALCDAESSVGNVPHPTGETRG